MRIHGMASLIGIIVLGVASTATAVPSTRPGDCQAGIDGATATFFQKKAATLQQCEDQKVTGERDASTVCADDPDTARKVAQLADAAAATIAMACGGRDRTCGTS